ncbi:hypothetical protein [Parageobacillus toebii]|uniref:hypothetical protein n=1 Tax=Parageobacillus toebii TaxID=153151 RepID=UPI0019675008|nr:hypothetical protein [Parageobacillus toebii]QSB48749.1 hypothetical protein JTI59_17060 [Parageobacillus toebii]
MERSKSKEVHRVTNVEFVRVCKSYDGKKYVIHDLNASIESGEFFVPANGFRWLLMKQIAHFLMFMASGFHILFLLIR